jgi:hypothetical protein
MWNCIQTNGGSDAGPENKSPPIMNFLSNMEDDFRGFSLSEKNIPETRRDEWELDGGRGDVVRGGAGEERWCKGSPESQGEARAGKSDFPRGCYIKKISMELKR